MARTKTRPGTAPSAAHAAPDPAPAPAAAPAPGSPAAAVCAALAARPGATAAVIADAAGTGKPAARDALLAMEKDGTATRVKGGKPGIPDTWALARAAQDDAGPAEAGPEDEQGRQPGDGTASSPDGPGDAEEAAAVAHDPAAETASPGQQDAEADTSAGPAPHNDDATADGEQDDGDPQDPGDGHAPREDAVPQDGDGDAEDAPDPALVTDLTGRFDQIRAAADAAELVLTASGDLKTVLAGLDEIYEQAAEARRALKAAIGGRKAPAVRPGGLRDKVLAHLAAYPDGEFTPHEIHKVLGHSSGAIANALDTLVKLGQAEVAADKPRRFRRAAQPADAIPDAVPEAGSAQDDTELAGAA